MQHTFQMSHFSKSSTRPSHCPRFNFQWLENHPTRNIRRTTFFLHHEITPVSNHLGIEGPLNPKGILQTASGLWKHNQSGGVYVTRTRHVRILHFLSNKKIKKDKARILCDFNNTHGVCGCVCTRCSYSSRYTTTTRSRLTVAISPTTATVAPTPCARTTWMGTYPHVSFLSISRMVRCARY